MSDATIKHIATILTVDPEALKPDPKLHRRRSIVRDFSLNTSTHGLPGIARSESIHNRLFWTVSFLIFAGVMVYFIVESIRAFFDYPTQTSVAVTIQRLQPFPAVSICNYSPIRFDTFIGPFINYTNPRGVTNTTDTSTITIQQSNYIRDFVQQLFNYNESIKSYLFPLESMLIGCIFNGAKCRSTDFIQFLSATYGLCYTYNAKIKLQDDSVRLATDHGGNGKLQLQLYAQSHQYVPYVSEDASAGMMVMIHDNTELPLIELAGIQLAPGRRHKLSYKKRTYQLLPSPYSDCTSEIPRVMQAMFDEYEGADYAYTSVLCYLLCTQTYVYQECHCTDPNQWTARGIVIPSTGELISAPLCNISDTCYVDATSRITNTDSIWNQFCSQCSEPCSSVDFIISASSVSAPAMTRVRDIKSFVERSGIPTPINWNQTWMTEVQNNYVSVDVVRETSRVEAYTEDPSIGSVDLISNIGGHTGLWIGISFLSIMELVEMLYRIIRYHFYVVKRQKEGDAVVREQF